VNLIGLLRELRLMKDQPSHRFYAVWLLVLLRLLLISLVLVGGVMAAPGEVTKMVSNFF